MAKTLVSLHCLARLFGRKRFAAKARRKRGFFYQIFAFSYASQYMLLMRLPLHCMVAVQ